MTELTPDDPRHGTASCYTGHACRCDLCRAAVAEYNGAWRRANRERVKAVNKARRDATLEEVKARRRSHYAANSDRLRAANNVWRLANPVDPAEISAKNRARYVANREAIKAASRAYLLAHPDKDKERYAANREKFREHGRAYYAANTEKEAARSKVYRAANPDKARKHASDRSARIRGAFVESIDPAVVYERDGGICQICSGPIGNGKWHIDHIYPLVRGGEHSYANVQLAHARCNLRKWAHVAEPNLPLVGSGVGVLRSSLQHD